MTCGGGRRNLEVGVKFPCLDKLRNIIKKRIRYIFKRSFSLILLHEYTMVLSSSSFTFPFDIISKTAKRTSTKFGIHMRISFSALLLKYNPYFPWCSCSCSHDVHVPVMSMFPWCSCSRDVHVPMMSMFVFPWCSCSCSHDVISPKIFFSKLTWNITLSIIILSYSLISCLKIGIRKLAWILFRDPVRTER